MYWVIMVIGGVIYFIMLIAQSALEASEKSNGHEKSNGQSGDPSVWVFTALALYFIFVIFSGLNLLSVDKERNPIEFNICRTTLLSPIAIIPACIILVIVRNAKRKIKEEAESLKLEQRLRRRREKEERERRAGQERDRIKKNLIATGLFYEDDPWGKLYDVKEN